MILNFLKLAFRQAIRHKGLALTNVIGLSTAMAFCILIVLFVQHELSFDNQYNKNERIFRISTDYEMVGSVKKMATVAGNAGSEFMNALPEVESFTRIQKSPYGNDFIVGYDGKKIEDKRLFLADSSLFSLFKYNFVYGNSQDALLGTNNVVITKSVSQKLFGDENPMGNKLTILEKSYTITAVVNDENFKSHLNFNYLISLSPFARGNDEAYNNWFRCPVNTYVSLSEKADVNLMPQKMQDVFRNRAGEDADKWGVKLDFDLMPISDIHLKSHLEYEFESNSNIFYIYYLSIVCVLLLVVAIINFVNLVTAQSFKRASEIGLRKVFGSSRMQLIPQFISESFLITLLSLLISVFIVLLLLPFYNNFLAIDFSMVNLLKGPILFAMALMWLFSGLGAGIYPAFVLSNYKPADTIGGKLTHGTKRQRFMKSMVIFQFAVTTILIFSTLIMQKQVSFMQNMKMNFVPEQTLIIKAKSWDIIDKSVVVKEELLKNSAINEATFSYTYPGLAATHDGAYLQEGKDENETLLCRWQGVDFDYIDFFGLDIIKGRNFDMNLSSDSTDAYILNETAVRLFNAGDDILGKRLTSVSNGSTGIIIGIIKDFNQETLKNELVPLVYQIVPTGGTFLALKVNSPSAPETIDWIEEKWAGFEPDRNMEYFFMDDYYNLLYKEDKKMGNLFFVFSLVIIVIASLGLLGLVSFITLQKTKEIGVRKVNGASIYSILGMLNKEFIKWMLIALVIGIPIAFYGMQRWLQTFAYKTTLSWWIFAVTGFLILLTSILAVSWLTFKAARRNPIEALRYE